MNTQLAGQSSGSDWRRWLPREWGARVVAPLRFVRHREHEVDGARTVGLDAAERPCFCEHHVVLADIRCDDDEEFYSCRRYWEHLIAFRLLDGRWLVRRRVNGGADCSSHHYTLSIDVAMPR